MQRARQAVLESGRGTGVEGRRPNPGGDHAGGRQAETDRVVGHHEAIHVLVFFADEQRHQERGAVEAGQQQNGRGGR
ncbi:hypothetical protein D3C77_716440 [compost metagenome]